MQIEKNVIFIYPITKKLQEAKTKFEEEGDYTIYELDSVDEYNQLIGVLEHSVTFSSDEKKTEKYLEMSKQFIKHNNAKNFFVREKTISPIVLSKFQKNGLNEFIKESAPLKSFEHKIKMFFDNVERQLKVAEEKKNKAEMAVLSMTKNKTIGEKKEESNQKMRVEKMAFMDETIGDNQNKKKKKSFDLSMFQNGGLSNLELKPNQSDTPFLKSPFDEMQRKKVATFDPVAAKSNLKKSNFNPIVGELNNNPYKNSLGLKEAGELSRKDVGKFTEVQRELEKKELQHNEQAQALAKKRKKFEEVQTQLKKKSTQFDEVARELERKKHESQEEGGELKKKNLNRFEEVDIEREKKKLTEFDSVLERKKKEFEELDEDYNRKKKKFDEQELDYGKKRAELNELDLLNKKKRKILDELEELNRKKKGTIEEFLEKNKVKDKTFEEIEIEKNNKNITFDEGDLDKKKGKGFEASEFDKKRKTFEEVEQDINKKNIDIEFDQIDKNKKNHKFEEIEFDKNRNHVDFENNDDKKKRGTFEEVEPEGKEFKKVDLNFEIGSKKDEDELQDDINKNFKEQVLDYGKFKKQFLDGDFSDNTDEESLDAKKSIEKALDFPEYTFFASESFGLEYLVFYNDFLLKENINVDNLYKFIHFCLIKEFNAHISIYLYEPNSDPESEPLNQYKEIYYGHKEEDRKVMNSNFDSVKAKNFNHWHETKIPFWKDETYQLEVNEFVYPFFEDGKKLGFMVGHFNQTIKNHSDAYKVELLIINLKGAILSTFEHNNESI